MRETPKTVKMVNKICIKCNLNKDINEFKISKGNLNKCIVCVLEYNRNRYQKHKERLQQLHKNNTITTKLCKVCNTIKDISHFSVKYDNKDGYCSYCKDCSNKKLSKYYPERYQKRKKERKEKRENKEEVLSKICKICNIEKNISNYKKTDFGKYKLNCKDCPDITYNINERLKNLHRGHMNRYKIKRYKSSSEYLNCDISVLKNWLEYQFEKDMTWDNFGTVWSIDHIIPLSRFDLNNPKHQTIAFSWTNLQPCKDNFSKGSKIRLYEYFNSIVSIHRFIQKYKLNLSGYQIVNESLQWLREYLRYGKKSTDEIGNLSYLFQDLSIKMDDPHPSS